MQRLAGKLDNVHADVRQEFSQLAESTAAKAVREPKPRAMSQTITSGTPANIETASRPAKKQ